MALGAAEQDVQSQFLIEAVTLSMLGGLFGIAFGLFGSSLINKLLMPTLLPAKAMLIAAIFSIAWEFSSDFILSGKPPSSIPFEALWYE